MRVTTLPKTLAGWLDGPIARSTLLGVVIRFAGIGLMLFQAVLLARWLGAESYGLVTILLAVGQIAVALALRGIGPFAVAEVPRRLKAGESAIAWSFARYGASRIIRSTLVVAPLALVASWLILGDVEFELIAPVLLSIPLMAGILLMRGIAQGIGRPNRAQLPGELIRPALLIVALIAIWFFAELNAALFMLAFAITAGLAMGFACTTIASHNPGEPGKPNSVSYSDWDRLARPFFGIQLLMILQIELATVMLGYFAGPEEVGLFQPVARIALAMLVPIQALNLAFNPRIAGLLAEGKASEVAALAHKWTLAATGMMIIGGVVLGLATPFLLTFFGPEFGVNSALVWLLIGARILQGLLGPGSELMTMSGHANFAVRGQLFGVIAELGCGLALIPIYGATGAALAIVVGSAVRGLALAHSSERKLGIGLRQFWWPARSPRQTA